MKKGFDLMKCKENRKSILSIILVLFFLVFMTCFVYLPKQESLLSSLAFLQNQKVFYLKDLSHGILLNDAIPIPDEIGMQYEPYRFKVVNNSSSEINYRIIFRNNDLKMNIKKEDMLSNQYLRISLNSDKGILVNPTSLSENGIIYTTTIQAHKEEIFELRMWLDWNSDNDAMDKIFVGKVEIDKLS